MISPDASTSVEIAGADTSFSCRGGDRAPPDLRSHQPARGARGIAQAALHGAAIPLRHGGLDAGAHRRVDLCKQARLVVRGPKREGACGVAGAALVEEPRGHRGVGGAQHGGAAPVVEGFMNRACFVGSASREVAPEVRRQHLLGGLAQRVGTPRQGYIDGGAVRHGEHTSWAILELYWRYYIRVSTVDFGGRALPAKEAWAGSVGAAPLRTVRSATAARARTVSLRAAHCISCLRALSTRGGLRIMDVMLAARTSLLPGPVLVDYQHPEGHTITHVRGIMLANTRDNLRGIGLYEDYQRLLPEPARSALAEAVASAFIPVEHVLAHYQACDRLPISAEQFALFGRRQAERVRDTFLGITLQRARSLGLTDLKAMLGRVGQLHERIYRGGGCAAIELGPKDVHFEISGFPFAECHAFRSGWVAYTEAFSALFVRVATAKQTRPRTPHPHRLALRVSWV